MYYITETSAENLIVMYYKISCHGKLLEGKPNWKETIPVHIKLKFHYYILQVNVQNLKQSSNLFPLSN